MIQTKSFIVLEGYLHETMEFEMLRGYETSTTMEEDRISRQECTVTAQLLNDQGETLVVATPEVRFPAGCSATPSAPGLGLLRVALARHPSTRKIELRAYDRIIFSAPVASESPAMLNVKLEPRVEDTSIQFRFNRILQPAEEVQFLLIDATNRRLPINPTVSGENYSINLAPYGGRENAKIGVAVSRDFRTFETISLPFDLPSVTIRGRILEPSNQAEYSWGISGSLIGNLFDDTSRAISWDEQRVAWVIDDLLLQDSRQIASFHDLSSGRHVAELRFHMPNGNTSVLDRVHFFVREKSEAQIEYEVVLSEYLETWKRIHTKGSPNEK